MNLLPNPLHPAVVHFPIVLLLLGAVLTLAAVFWRQHGVPAMAAGLLILGAFGTWAAVETGESDGGLVEDTSVNALVDAHETWAKRTLTISIIAGLVALGSVLAARWPRIARALAIVAALASATAAYSIYQTGHRGGALVYRYGAGVNGVASLSAPPDAKKEGMSATAPDRD